MSQVDDQKRFALVIGNASYTKLGHLACCREDAAQMAKVLAILDFKIHTGSPLHDLTLNQIEEQTQAFIKSLEACQSAVAVLYFSGHGCHNTANQSFILPVDYTSNMDLDPKKYFCASTTVNAIEKATSGGVCIAIFDACRNIPTKSDDTTTSLVSSKTGTAAMNVTGSIIGYSCEEGTVSNTGYPTSLYTQGLLKHLQTPEDIGIIFRMANHELKHHSQNMGPHPQRSRYIDALQTRDRISLTRQKFSPIISSSLITFRNENGPILCHTHPSSAIVWAENLKCEEREYITINFGEPVIICYEDIDWCVTLNNDDWIILEDRTVKIDKKDVRLYKNTILRPTRVVPGLLYLDYKKIIDGLHSSCPYYILSSGCRKATGYWVKVILPKSNHFTGYIYSGLISKDLITRYPDQLEQLEPRVPATLWNRLRNCILSREYAGV